MPLVLGHLDKMRVEIGSQYSHIYMVPGYRSYGYGYGRSYGGYGGYRSYGYGK